jgi:transposase
VVELQCRLSRLAFVSDEPGAAGEQGELVSRLRAVIGAKDEQIAVLTAALEVALDRERRLELRLAEVERRLSMDSTDSGTPSSKERIGAKEARRARQQSERERRKDRRRGGQPGHQGKGLERDPEPGENKDAGPPAECRGCGCPWTVRRLRDRGGRTSLTCRLSGR